LGEPEADGDSQVENPRLFCRFFAFAEKRRSIPYYTGAEVTETYVSESFTHWAKNRSTQVDRVFFKVMPQAARNAAGELNVLD
jgi:hypothetical protein